MSFARRVELIFQIFCESRKPRIALRRIVDLEEVILPRERQHEQIDDRVLISLVGARKTGPEGLPFTSQATLLRLGAVLATSMKSAGALADSISGRPLYVGR
jgi:hypothetical protein